VKSPSATSVFGLGLFTGVFALDQATKFWSRTVFSLPNGEPDYFKTLQVLGDWLQFRLVYNSGAAFGIRPQNILPFLHPTLFYGLFSLAAIIILGIYFRKLAPGDSASRIGIILILAGAAGNLIDRLCFHKVTDFIDAGIPGFFPRWPTFNVADSSVCIGMGILILFPMFAPRSKSAHSSNPPTPQDSSPATISGPDAG